MLIPSIDIINGKAVQLKQGKEFVLESERSPMELARDFNRCGEIAVIDLDAAMGKGNNRELIKDICRIADVRVGGGIRDIGRGFPGLQPSKNCWRKNFWQGFGAGIY